MPSLREPPGRVVATLYDADADQGHQSAPPIDTHVFDEWTAEAEAEARDSLLAAGGDEATLEPSAHAEAPRSRGAWLIVGGLGLGGVTLLVVGASAGLAALVGALAWAL
jgi:hypothetical protein